MSDVQNILMQHEKGLSQKGWPFLSRERLCVE